jgi:hypothetical protein
MIPDLKVVLLLIRCHQPKKSSSYIMDKAHDSESIDRLIREEPNVNSILATVSGKRTHRGIFRTEMNEHFDEVSYY